MTLARVLLSVIVFAVIMALILYIKLHSGSDTDDAP